MTNPYNKLFDEFNTQQHKWNSGGYIGSNSNYMGQAHPEVFSPAEINPATPLRVSLSTYKDSMNSTTRFSLTVLDQKSNETYKSEGSVSDEKLASDEFLSTVTKLVHKMVNEIPDPVRPPVSIVSFCFEELIKSGGGMMGFLSYKAPAEPIFAALHHPTAPPKEKQWHEDVAEESRRLPGVSEKVVCPCERPAIPLVIDSYESAGLRYMVEECCTLKGFVGQNNTSTIRNIIIHLNDDIKWSREKIADWLDELHDSGQVNIEFQPWDEGDTHE